MKTNKKYEEPLIRVVMIQHGSIICSSGGSGRTQTYNDGGDTSPWF